MRPSESDRGRHNGSGLRCSANGPECVPLSPEPAPGQRHALSDGPARSLSLIFHLRAAWQDLEFCLMHAVLRAAEHSGRAAAAKNKDHTRVVGESGGCELQRAAAAAEAADAAGGV